MAADRMTDLSRVRLGRVLAWAREWIGTEYDDTDDGIRALLDDLTHDYEVTAREGQEAEAEIRALRQQLAAAERRTVRAHSADPWEDDYEADERDAIQHEPPSVYYRLRHPEV
jgi:plasmid stability protein